MVKYRTSVTEKRFREWFDFVNQTRSWGDEFVEVVGQAVFSGKKIVFKEEDKMKAVTVDEINAKLTTAAMLDAAEVEESPFPIPFAGLPEEPEWDEERPLGPPPAPEEVEDNGGEF